MGDADFIPFPGNLDPRAQEFFPRNPYTSYPLPPVQFYYPYHPPPPPAAAAAAQYLEVLAYPQPTALPAPCLPPQSSIPTRTLLVSMVPSDVSESLVRRELEVFGDVRAVQMERVRDGIVTVHFYDLRHAQAAAAEIQDKHMQQQYRLRRHYESAAGVSLPPPLPSPAPGLISGRAVWAQFIIPVTCSIPGGNNQGTLVLLNLDPDVSAAHLKDIFRAFGAVKELRETPMKRHQRFVEFYDVRDAANALVHMNHKEINGKPVFIEFSRPGGNNSRRRYPFSSPKPRPITTHSPPPCHHTSNPYSDKHPGRIGSPSVKDSMESLTIRNGNGNGNGNGNDWYNGHCQRNPKKSWRKGGKNSPSSSPSPSPSSSSSKQQRVRTTVKPWRKSNVGGNENDPRFMINEEEIKESDCRDSRTTVMIKNIPNKYSQKLLLNMLDNHCIHCNEQIAPAATHHHDGGDDPHHHHLPKSSYDFVYLPIDFVNKCNVGYGFVNMTSPEAAWRLYKAFHLQTWEAFNSRKICEVTYARIQGIEALKEHFKNSRFPCEAEEYMPVVFSPPRDGRTLTAPLPIFGCGENPPPPSTTTVEERDENLRLVAINGDDGGTGINEDGGGGTSNDGGGDVGLFDDGNDDEGDGN